MFSLAHHGAVTGVTGSCHQLLLDNGHSLLVDCGMFQGAEATPGADADSLERRTQITFDISSVRVLLVTHCHIDHVGRLPWLLAAGFDGPVYASRATCELLPLVIEDALKVGVTRDAGLINQVVGRLKTMLRPVDYGAAVPLPELEQDGQSVVACFKPAGHILGSAYIELTITSSASGATEQSSQKVVFSGDLGARDTPLLPDPEPLLSADVLVLESTYGDKNHGDRRNRRARLESALKRCLANAGTVLIPAFSIGRTQELLYELEDIFHHLPESSGGRSGLTDAVDVVVDSPLAARFTGHYRRLSEYWDAEARQRLVAGRHPLNFDQLLTIESHQDHMNAVGYLRRTGRPAIVIAASGMCAGGRIVNYLKALLADERTDVLFVGYQARGTLGRDIQHWGPKGGYVFVDGQKVNIAANVETLSGYSAHADQDDLLAFAKGPSGHGSPVRHVVLVHGDDDAKQQLKLVLEREMPGVDVVVPATPHESYRLPLV